MSAFRTPLLSVAKRRKTPRCDLPSVRQVGGTCYIFAPSVLLAVVGVPCVSPDDGAREVLLFLSKTIASTAGTESATTFCEAMPKSILYWYCHVRESHQDVERLYDGEEDESYVVSEYVYYPGDGDAAKLSAPMAAKLSGQMDTGGHESDMMVATLLGAKVAVAQCFGGYVSVAPERSRRVDLLRHTYQKCTDTGVPVVPSGWWDTDCGEYGATLSSHVERVGSLLCTPQSPALAVVQYMCKDTAHGDEHARVLFDGLYKAYSRREPLKVFGLVATFDGRESQPHASAVVRCWTGPGQYYYYVLDPHGTNQPLSGERADNRALTRVLCLVGNTDKIPEGAMQNVVPNP